MKIRNGYVSNSSSSSFIVEYKSDNIASCEEFSITVDDFMHFINTNSNWSTDSTTLECCGKGDVIEYIKDNYYDEKDRNELINKVEKAQDDVAVVRIEYHDNLSNKLFKFLIQKEAIKLLQETQS